jgi:hypothetical protein
MWVYRQYYSKYHLLPVAFYESCQLNYFPIEESDLSLVVAGRQEKQ